MSLNFNVSKVADFEQVTKLTNPDGSTRWHPHTEALIFLSVPCGFNKITEENWKVVAGRVLAWERAFGYSVHNDKGPMPLTPAIVKAHVGLTTNATPRTKASFLKALGEEMLRDAADRVAAYDVLVKQ